MDDASIELLRKELEEQRAASNAIFAGLEWTGDGYEWNPKHGDYREAPYDAVARGAQEYQKEMSRMRKMLSDAALDIFCWLQLAERQRKELPDVDHLPCGPTAYGIEQSQRLRTRIQEVLDSCGNTKTTEDTRLLDSLTSLIGWACAQLPDEEVRRNPIIQQAIRVVQHHASS